MEAIYDYIQEFCNRVARITGVELFSYPAITLLAIAVLLFIFLMLLRLLNTGPQQIVAFDSADGKVTVSPNAVGEIIQKAASASSGIARCKSRLQVRRGNLHINIRLQLKAGSKMKLVEEQLKRHIRHTMQDMLGMDNVGSINIEITGIVGNPMPPQQEVPQEQPRLLSRYDADPEVTEPDQEKPKTT